MARNMDEKQPLLKNENSSQIDIEAGMIPKKNQSTIEREIMRVEIQVRCLIINERDFLFILYNLRISDLWRML